MIQWYYADAQRERHGPVEDRDIRALYQRGELNGQTLVWREGLSEWAPLESLAEELELHRAAPAASGGIDLRADLAAIANGTAPLPGTGGGTHSPYAASSTAMGSGNHPVHSDGPIVHAGLWRRFAASIIDSIVTSIASYIVLIPLALIMGIGMGEIMGTESSGASILFMLAQYGLGIGIPAAYFGWMHSSSSMASLGKMAVGIKVCRTNGEGISFARAIGRYFAYTLFAVFTCGLGVLISGLMVAFSQNKQALHDMICDTIVVDRWAFTDQPELQSESLGTVTIVILALFGLLIVGGIILAVVAGAALASMAG
jgi:uncharacterized RDD family membrane protein YckC